MVPRSLLLGCLRVVERHGRVLERSPFPSPAGSERASEHAFRQLGLAESGPADDFLELEHEQVPDRRRLASCRLWSFRAGRGHAATACERHQNMRILFLLDNLALFLLLSKGRTRFFVCRHPSDMWSRIPCKLSFGISMGAVGGVYSIICVFCNNSAGHHLLSTRHRSALSSAHHHVNTRRYTS